MNQSQQPYECTPRFINGQNFNYFLTWSLITIDNIKYDNFMSLTEDKNGNVTGNIRSNNYKLFKASLNIKSDGSSFTINTIDYDTINSGITTGMTFTYKDDHKYNPDTWTYTWYEVENTNIKLIPNIDCTTQPSPTPTSDLSMKCNPKCLQILDSSSGKKCDPMLISDRSTYNGVNNWSITSYDGKLYEGFTIKWESYKPGGHTFNIYNNNDKNFIMKLVTQYIGSPESSTSSLVNTYTPQPITILVEPDIQYVCIFINDTINLGIEVNDHFNLNGDYNYYVCQKGMSYTPNIKIFPTSCTQYLPTPIPTPTPNPSSSLTRYSTKKTIFFIIGILSLITGIILFYYINQKTKIKLIEKNKKLYSGLSIFFIILGIIFIILYLTSKHNQVKYSPSTPIYCIKNCKKDCGQDDGCGKGTTCDLTYITNNRLLGKPNWQLLTSSGNIYNIIVTIDRDTTINILTPDNKTFAAIITLDGTKNFIIKQLYMDNINSGINDDDKFIINETNNYVNNNNSDIKIFPIICAS